MDKKVKVAINGFGRIGRSFFRQAEKGEDIEIVAVNDLGDVDNLAYLLRYDTAQGNIDYKIETTENSFTVNGRTIAFLQKKDPVTLPWKDLEVDVVLESTGVFTDYQKAGAHLEAGAKHVVISAPAKGEPSPGVTAATTLMGVNDDKIGTCQITSNASCTTNAGSPVIAIMNESIGIEKALLNTVHGYTATQSLVDGPNKKDFRRGRAAAMNMIPTSTGAAQATTKAYPSLEGLFDGIAIRIPIISGSLADITFVAKRDTSVEEVNNIFIQASKSDRWRNIFAVNDEPIVSSDIIGKPYASILDVNYTRVVGGNLVKVLAWYDNEMGYTTTLIHHAIKAGQSIT